MYPVFRLIKEFFVIRNAPKIGLTDTHVSTHICWPWDLDLFMELNNGRTLTLYDLGRLPLAKRAGLVDALRRNGWGLTMAGASVRYRKRVRMFDRITIKSRAVCWDDRFIYLEQSMWRGDVPTSHILYRSAVTSPEGIVEPTKVVEDILGASSHSPEIPTWIASWVAAEALRPWPPQTV